MEPQGYPVATFELPIATPIDRRIANARSALARNLPRFVDRPELHLGAFGKAALVSGGPSAADFLDDIRGHETVIACGSAGDWLVGNGVEPTYCVAFDPGKDHAKFYRKRPPNTIYLVSSTCDPSVFDTLDGCDVHLWHPWDDIDEAVFDYEPRINGGSTVSLRAIAMAHVMGLREMHIYGMDCSYGSDGIEHAYPYEQDRPQAMAVNYEGRIFMTTPQLLQQAHEFMAICHHHQGDMSVNVYGGGLMGAMFRQQRGPADA